MESSPPTPAETPPGGESSSRAQEPPRPRMADRLREKAPEILLEVISVVVAVFLALAVNGWAGEAKERRQAERARQGVLDEIRANYEELLSNYDENRQSLERARGAVAELKAYRDTIDAGGEAVEPEGVSVTFSLSLLSSASWHTAQLTLAVHHLEYAWISKVAKLYELQDLYDARQDDLVAFLTSLAQMEDGEELKMMADLANRLDTTMNLLEGLLRAYADSHAQLEVPEEVLERRAGED